MPSTKKTLDKFLTLLDSVQNEIFENGQKSTIYNGEVYTNYEFNDMRRAIKQVQKAYQCGIKKSSKYLSKYPEYNRLQRKLSYYRRKERKTESDYEVIEEIQKQVKQFHLQKDINKMSKLLSAKKRTEKNLEELETKNKENEKYGFFD